MSSVVIAGDTSGTITIAAPAVAGSGTLTLPVATDTLVGKATTDTLTNKTLTAPVLSGSLTGTYTLAGTPTISSPSISSAVMTTMASSVITSGTAVSTATCSFTGVISGTALTASAITGTIAIGQLITGTGVTAGTTIISGSGTAWVVSVSQTVSSTAITVVGIDFTGIPSWVKKVTVLWNGVSTNGTSNPIIQLGDSGGIEATGYLGAASNMASGVATQNFTTGFGVFGTAGWTAARVVYGGLIISKIDGNTWVASGTWAASDDNQVGVTSGAKALSDTLTQVRITTVGGTNTFDAGSVNILYE